ncbi:MAG: gliding motility-associated-like protein, partial [Psychroserpens sp.]
SGTYAVQVDLVDCMASGEIELLSELFEGSINVSEINTIEEGGTLSVVVTTNANNPVFEWYLNDIIIANVSEDNYEATQFGTYKIIVTETTGCIGSREFIFELQEAFDPFPDVEKISNIISPNGDGVNDTWMIPLVYTSGTNTEVMIMTNTGKVVVQTNNYLNNWPENDLNLNSVNQVFYYMITTSDNETKKGSITVIK